MNLKNNGDELQSIIDTLISAKGEMQSVDLDKYRIDTRRVVGAIRDALTLEEGRESTIIGSTTKMLIYAYQEIQTRDIYITSPCLWELDIKSYYTPETSREVSTLLCVAPFKKH